MSSTGLQIAAERLLDLELTYGQLRDLVRLVVADPRLFGATRHALRSRRHSSVAASRRVLECVGETKDVEGVRSALAAGADPNVRDALGETALRLAARADPMWIGDADDPDAIRTRSAQIVTMLLDAGADPDARNSVGETALHSTVFQMRIDIADILLAAGADLDVRDKRDHTPLDNATLMKRTDFAKRFLAAGATPTSLDLATSHGHAELMTMLLEAGANPRVHTGVFSNNTPLHTAASMHGPEIVQILLTAGADPNATNVVGNTPLHVAARANRHENVTLLLDAGADPAIRNRTGETPLETNAASCRDVAAALLHLL